MAILRSAADQQIVKPFQTHGWSAEITDAKDDGEYLVITAVKSGVTRRVALLYSSATDNKFYKKLDSEVDRTFTNGELYHPESFAYGLKKPVVPVDQFFPVLVAWNKELHPETTHPSPRPRPSKVHLIKAENPLVGIWARLDQFASTESGGSSSGGAPKSNRSISRTKKSKAKASASHSLCGTRRTTSELSLSKV